jgi:antitoxin component YwqK of YwqJK toxin-antitoxin module
MACKPALCLFLLLFAITNSVQAQQIKSSVILHDGYDEDNNLVRNHTVVYYLHTTKRLIAGYVTVDQIVEYANRDLFNSFTTSVNRDTLLYFHGILEKGKKSGTFLDFPQDNIFYIYTYQNDKQNGEFVAYYYSGQLYCKGNYKNGKQVGEYRQYYANGKPSLYREFSSGVDNLLYQEYYYQNGQVESKGSIYNGKKVNEWHYFAFQGNLLRTEYYRKGRLVRTKK